MQMREMHNPQVPTGQQEYVRNRLNTTAEGELVEALELSERECSEPFEVCQRHLALGQLYLTLSDYPSAKVHTRKGLIKLDKVRSKVSPLFWRRSTTTWAASATSSRTTPTQKSTTSEQLTSCAQEGPRNTGSSASGITWR